MNLRVKSLAELATLRATLKQREREAAERARVERRRADEQQREQTLFVREVGNVTPLPLRHRVRPLQQRELPPPTPLQRLRDEREALRSTLSDPFDVESLMETDERLTFRRPEIGPEVLRKLRRGVWAIQSEIDLHGLTRDAARDAVSEFLREARTQGWRCLRIVHGKGNRSPGRVPVLKPHIGKWLTQHESVIAYAQARASDGGAGALLVLLRPSATPVRGAGGRRDER